MTKIINPDTAKIYSPFLLQASIIVFDSLQPSVCLHEVAYWYILSVGAQIDFSLSSSLDIPSNTKWSMKTHSPYSPSREKLSSCQWKSRLVIYIILTNSSVCFTGHSHGFLPTSSHLPTSSSHAKWFRWFW